MPDVTHEIKPEAETLIETYKDTARRSTVEGGSGGAKKEGRVSFSVDAAGATEGDTSTTNEDSSQEGPGSRKSTHKNRLRRLSEENNKHRRTSILGNLQTEKGRRYSVTHLAHHLTEEQRKAAGEEGGFSLPPDDYYLMEDLDALGIFLEKPDKIPGGVASLLIPERLPTDADEPEEEPPENAVLPIARNTTELQHKLAVVRSLRSYQKHNQLYAKKCYFEEDDVDLSFLTKKPPSFLIFGKPGIGKTTLGQKLAEKMHSVHLNPENVIEYFHRLKREPLSSIKVNEILENGGSIGDATVVELLQRRIKEFDVLHRGYILEGFPLVTSDELTADEQFRMLGKLPIAPEYLIIMQMQDKDLYKRRVSQMFDPGTGRVFSERQYSNRDPDHAIFNRKSTKYQWGSFTEGYHSHHQHRLGGGQVHGGDETLSENPITEEASDTVRRESPQNDTDLEGPENLNEIDFPKLPAEILDQLFTRTEDFNVIINDDLESFRFNFEDLQRFVENFDKRKVLEVDAYWSPTIVFKRVWEYCEAVGIQPVPTPVQIMRPLPYHYNKKERSDGGEDEDEDDEESEDESDDDELGDKGDEKSRTDETYDPICEDDPPQEIDWEAVIRAVCVRGLVDPRFRWRVSRWYNICPVALKLGRSICGKPELAVSFMDKVFFLSSKAAVDQFINNPRPYLLPKMPTSPIKFVVIGHPLAGKTTFAKELATMTESTVIDVSREIIKRFATVRRDHMWKKRLKFSLEATYIVNQENALRWQKQERSRRRDMHAWIENYLRELAEAEILAALERDRDELHRLRIELRKQLEYHKMGQPYAGDGVCQLTDGTMHFDWKRFVIEAFGGRSNWTHQEWLELAWDLFHQRRLYYKRWKRDKINLTAKESVSEELSAAALPKTYSFEESSELEMEEGTEEESLDLSVKVKKRRKKKKKRKCVHLQVRPVEPEEIIEPFLFDTFDVDPDDPEVEESVRMRFPMIPFELVDIVPSPPFVGDLDPVVQMIVEEKMQKEAAYVDSLPPEIFTEILRRAIVDIEIRYRRRCKHGSLTGGWIIDNFPPEIDKWRAVLRTPQICPDQVFLMLDLTEGNITVWNRFKKLYKLLHPTTALTADNHPNSPRSPSTHEPILGEDGQEIGYKKKRKRPSHGLPGEDGGIPGEVEEPIKQVVVEVARPTESNLGDDLFETFHTSPSPSSPRGSLTSRMGRSASSEGEDIDRRSLDVVSASHFILSLLPQDDLNTLKMSPSEHAMIERDLHRIQTAVISDVDDESVIVEALEGHQKYILDAQEKEGTPVDVDNDDGDSLASDDFDELAKKREAALKLKPIYGEMSACLADIDGDNNAGRNSFDGQVPAFDKMHSLKNPPGTPEEIYEEGEQNWIVPVPEEIRTGELPLTKQEIDTKALLEEQIKRLSRSQKGEDDENTRTPTEVGSEVGYPPSTIGDTTEDEEREAIYQKLLNNKIESPKRKFFSQIRLFNEFWNMALPVCNQQGLRTWEVGLCDQDTALEKGSFIWNELEARFDVKAKKVLETELKEVDEEIMASLMKWGEPYELSDIRYRPATVKNDDDEEESQLDSELDDEDLTDLGKAGSEASHKSMNAAERDDLAGLENKPDLYWKAVNRSEAERCFGDFKYYCPVTYADHNLVRKGYSTYCCKYRDRLYYCANENNQLRFLTNPKQFLFKTGPPTPPPPRICITGSPGCLQEEIASQLCTEHKVCYINFRQKLHEIIKARLGREVGPDQTGVIVPMDVSIGLIGACDPADDLLAVPSTSPPRSNIKSKTPSDEEGTKSVGFLSSAAEEGHQATTTIMSQKSMNNIPGQEIGNEEDQQLVQESSLKSLGLLSSHHIETIPMNSIEKTEIMTERKWEKLTWIESHIQAFLENGIQLPDQVLDEFILPLWKDTPFTKVGFILVGFPNTEADVQYMLRNNLIPEHVIVMECKSIVVRNRLIVPAVDRWHHEKNPSGKRYRKLTLRSQRAKFHMELVALGMLNKVKEIFPYQTEGRENVDEFENETWSYNDALSRDISRALKYYYQIYSGGMNKMKKILNKERFCWTPVDTNTGIHQGKHTVLDKVSAMLKYRDNLFEDTVRLSFPAAQALLDRGVFTLSGLERWCPVELSKGNKGINVWNSPETKKIPYLHRRFIYFASGEKHAKKFEENTWQLINQDLPLQPVPLVCMILGKARTGKTTLAKALADKLGLLYVSLLEAVQSILYHAFVTEWAHVLNEANPALANSGRQPMFLANEVLEYIRQGRAIPRFLVYRCLDLFLMNPKAQCNGIVFDDFPNLIDELIEINYREMTPTIVINLKIPIIDAYARCEANRPPELTNDQQIPEESNDCIDYLWDLYGEATKETIMWFQREYQNIHKLDGTQNPVMVLNKAAEICIHGQNKILDYMTNLYHGRPNTLEGTCPITSSLYKRLNTEFGFFCPVALNDNDELISVKEVTDLSQVVEYKGKIYLFSGKIAVQKFLANPRRYTSANIVRTPPKDIPQTLTVSNEDWERMREHWGFQDFDPVLYYANHHFKGLQRGDPKYCVVYRRKLYIFINEENQKKFLRKPAQYWNLLLPMKLPKKAEPMDYEKITPYSYLSAKGMISVLRKVIKVMAEKKPKLPLMDPDQCAALYMGYYLKTLNMNSPYERRQRYRDAMFRISTKKNQSKDFVGELQNYFGHRQRTLPERLKRKLNEFIHFQRLPMNEKFLIPKIPGLNLSYDAIPPPFTDHQAARKVKRMMENMKDVELKEKLDAFSVYSKKKKAAQDAADRAAQDALDAAEMAKKMVEISQMRMLKAKSQHIAHGTTQLPHHPHTHHHSL